VLKVYQGGVIDHRHSKERHHNQCRAIVAAKSWREAHAIVRQRYPNISMGQMRGWWTITGNKKQIEAAMAKPRCLLLSTTLATDDYSEPRR